MSYTVSRFPIAPAGVSSPAEDVGCLATEALVAARDAVRWLGLKAESGTVRRCAAARLRYASLRSVDAADLMREIAQDLEQGGGQCRCCGRRLPE